MKTTYFYTALYVTLAAAAAISWDGHVGSHVAWQLYDIADEDEYQKREIVARGGDVEEEDTYEKRTLGARGGDVEEEDTYEKRALTARGGDVEEEDTYEKWFTTLLSF